MNLSDLFVSHKLTEAPTFRTLPIESSTPDIYMNKGRAKEAVSTETPEDTSTSSEETTTTWKVPELESENLSWTNPYANNRKQWVTDLTTAYKKQGLSDNAIKNLMAKNALESGWGSSVKGDFNFGNLTTGKNWTGKFKIGNDKNAEGKTISQNFRAYDSLDDYVKDEIQFLTSLYDFNQSDDIDTFVGKLEGNNSGKRRYAEDKEYGKKIRNVYRSV